jgi:amidase
MAISTVDHTLTDEQVVFAFGPDMTPALEVDPGAVVTLQMKDGLGNQLTREDQLINDVFTDLDLSRVNGTTGPVAVRGAEPGDSLVVEILDIRPARTGVAFATPGIGQLHRQLHEPVTTIFRVADGMIHMNDRISFRARPMLGVLGVATASGDPVPCGLAGRHGGNLDDHLNGVGSTLYMPVRQPGGMFAAGDMHAAMGDGEVCVTGVEVAGEVTMRFDVLKGAAGDWPVTELEDSWVVHGTAGPDVREAIELACEEAVRILVDQWSFSIPEAFVFLSVACDVGLCQSCQPSPFSTIARVKIPKIDACPTPFRGRA